MKVPFSYRDFLKLYPNRESAIAFYKEKHSTYCPDCGIQLKRPLRKKDPLLLRCPSCKKAVSIFTGTIFQGTRADLRYWLYVGALFCYCREYHPNFQIVSLLSQKTIKEEIGARSDQTIRRIYTTLRQLFESSAEDDSIFQELIFRPLVYNLTAPGFH